ncbi:MAG: PQQ-dependent sugar dehydrogenase [Alphaproteobacteria bacterium]|nr:PQQ-dependent sugar dehydrogenase [Alphaproteobacteria bacterium]
MRAHLSAIPLFFSAAILGAAVVPRSDAAAETLQAAGCTVESRVMISDLDHPWGVAFIPDVPQVLVTERRGRMLHVNFATQAVTDVVGVPDVRASGQGGLLDVAVDPNFDENRLIYLSYSESRPDGAGTAVGRGRLEIEDGTPLLAGFQVIFRMTKPTSSGRHFGSRLVFGPDDTLFITIGDRGARDRAQDRFDHAGSVVRINRDGSIPADNPFIGRDGLDDIWSIGHRNPQGAALNPATRELWTVAHGARGGDEINRPQKGKNYGWPVVSYGTHYSGAPIGEGSSAPGMEPPVWYWDPSIAPSGMAFVTGPLFPSWEGDILVGALKFRLLSKLDVDGNTITGEERMFKNVFGRIRDVRIGPDGGIWLLSDESDGQLVRITPVDGPC